MYLTTYLYVKSSLYTLNIHNFICQLNLGTAGKEGHRTLEHFPSCHTFPTHHYRPSYPSSFYPVQHVWLSTKKLRGEKHSL